jgi:esterase/lipase superfamily enzyme
MMRSAASAILFLSCLALAGCAGGRSRDIMADADAPATVAPRAMHRIHIATTRSPSDRATEVFSRGRSQYLAFAYVDVAVPPGHRIGEISRPRSGAPDPREHFIATRVGVHAGEDAFARAIRADLKRSGGRALIFVHGYNNRFDSSVYRLAQLVEDSGFSGTPVLFSWASAGRTFEYIYDKDSVNAAREELEDTMRVLAENGATRIDLVAHSMGTWLAVEALRQLAIAGNPDLGGRLGDVVLASPDIDVDVFRSQMLRIGKPKRPFFVLLSADDKALRLSSLLAGQSPRVGAYADADDLAAMGVVVVNMSELKAGDRRNHTKFANNPLLVRLLGAQLDDPDAFTGSSTDVVDAIAAVARGLGHAVGSAAELVITAPGEVLRVPVGE